MGNSIMREKNSQQMDLLRYNAGAHHEDSEYSTSYTPIGTVEEKGKKEKYLSLLLLQKFLGSQRLGRFLPTIRRVRDQHAGRVRS